MGRQSGSGDSGQVSETSQATPEGGADDTPGTEDGTPSAEDTQHSPHAGPRDYSTGAGGE